MSDITCDECEGTLGNHRQRCPRLSPKWGKAHGEVVLPGDDEEDEDAEETAANLWYRRAAAAEAQAGVLQRAVDDAVMFLEPIADKLPRIGERALTTLRAALAEAARHAFKP